jgi:hypothetical protein
MATYTVFTTSAAELGAKRNPGSPLLKTPYGEVPDFVASFTQNGKSDALEISIAIFDGTGISNKLRKTINKVLLNSIGSQAMEQRIRSKLGSNAPRFLQAVRGRNIAPSANMLG